MISESDIQKALALILQSQEFKESKRHHDLLKYLVEESIKNIPIKETTIAHDVFQKDSKFDPGEDPLVRVYVSNLRKKLEHYYLTTGDAVTVRFDIPKGQYVVKFLPADQSNRAKGKKFNHTFVYLAVIILLASVIVIQHFSGGNSLPDNNSFKNNPIWNEFLQSGSKPTMIVAGDYLFLYERNNSASGGQFIRDPRINSEEDFRDMLKQNPAYINRYVMLNFTFLRPSTTWGLSEVLPILWNSPNKIFLKLASQLKWDDLRSYNVVFIGSFKTLYKLNELLKNLNMRFNPAPAFLSILNSNGDTVKTFNPKDLRGGNYQKDYGIIAKIKGPMGNSILFLLGFDEVGIAEAARTSVDKNFIGKISEFAKTEIPINSFYFEIVLEAEGVEQTGFKSDIKYFDFIK